MHNFNVAALVPMVWNRIEQLDKDYGFVSVQNKGHALLEVYMVKSHGFQ